jgi:tetratricopeptide (TPR) repeat protein
MTVELSRRRLISVKMREGEEIISIHRSLQAKILQDLEKDPQKRDKVFDQAYLLVRKRFPLPSPIQVPEPEKWPACIKYLRHVLSLQKVYAGQLITIAPSVELARLLSDGGIGLWERGMTSEGLQLMRSAEAVLHKLNCKEDMLKANIHVIIALLIQDYGIAHLAESKDRIWQALQIRKDFQSQTPPKKYKKTDDILLHNAWSDYGCVLLQYNKYTEAEPIFAHCLTKYREWGPDESIPYEHAKYNHHMAFCQMYHKNFAEAIELAERGVHFVILATGKHSASTNKWKFDLACIVLQSGDVERALRLHEEVLEARVQQHGKSSFLTLQSYYAVGALNAYLGQLVPAEYVPALEIKLFVL